MTKAQLQNIKDRLHKTAPGDWQVSKSSWEATLVLTDKEVICLCDRANVDALDENAEEKYIGYHETDAEFIANSKNDIQDLLDYVEGLLNYVQDLQDKIDELVEYNRALECELEFIEESKAEYD